MSNSGLTQSRWAKPSNRLPSSDYRHLKGSISNPALAPQPTPPTPQSPEKKRQSTQTQEYTRFLKVLRRLKWKSSFLIHSHIRALTQETNNIIGGLNFPITSDTGKANAAEVMFKADFFEFYALLERCLVHLLGCFGMVITASHNQKHTATATVVPPPLSSIDLNRSIHSDTTTMSNTLIGDSRAFYGYPHRFHANVLAALDMPSNPLHSVLGTGKVRQYLGISKEFRNRWKEVEKEQDSRGVGGGDNFEGLHRSYHRILEELRLDEMVKEILLGLEEARGVAGSYLAGVNLVDVDMVVGMDGNDDDEIFDESMGLDDAMDWD